MTQLERLRFDQQARSRLPTWIGLSVSSVALLLLVSWRLHCPELIPNFQGSRPMLPNAALAFLVAGMTGCSLVQAKPYKYQVFLAALFIVGSFSVPARVHFQTQFAVSNFIFGLIGIPVSGPLSRMTIVPAIGFGIWGVGLLAHLCKQRSALGTVVSAVCGTLVLSLGCICLLNGWLGIPTSYADTPGAWMLQMPLMSALLFCGLGFILCSASLNDRPLARTKHGWSVELTVRFLVALILVILFAGVNITLGLGFEEHTRTREDMARTHRAGSAVKDFLAALHKTESAQRGYLLARNPSNLRSYEKSLEQMERAENECSKLSRGRASFAKLDGMIREKLSEIAQSIRLSDTGHSTEALAAARSGRGFILMEQIEVQVTKIETDNSSRLAAENAAYQKVTSLVERAVLASYALAIVFLCCAALFFHVEIVRRTTIENQLRAQEVELSTRVEEQTAELKASETRYRAMLDQSPVAIHVLDRQGNTVRVNAAFERMVGVPAEQMRGYNIFQDPQIVVQGTLDLLKSVFSGATIMTEAVPHIPQLSVGTPLHREGVRMAWAEVLAYPVKDELANVQEVVLLCHDVTDRERAITSVRESEFKFRLLANVVPQIVWTATPDGAVDYFNERWYALNGVAVDSDVDWRTVLHPDDLPVTVAAWAKSLQTRSPFEIQQRLWNAQNEEYRWHLARAIPVFDEGGNVTQWVGTTTEIQDQKTAEELLENRVSARTAELQQSYELLQWREDELRRSLSERDLLLREVHHRVKNNLQVISSLLRMQADSLKQNPAASTALEESRRRVLSLAMIHERLYSNQSIDQIDFTDYTSSLVRELVYSYTLPGRDVKIELDLQKVHLDVDRAIPCGLILNELVTNAMKYAFVGQESGVIKVHLQKTVAGSIQFSVSDNGMGLPEAFDWKALPSLGLPIVEILARQLDGRFQYDREGGAKFTISFQVPELTAKPVLDSAA